MSTGRRFAELTLTEAQRDAFLERVNARVSPEDYQVIAGMTHALPEMLTLLAEHPATLRKLQHLLFGPKSEATDRVCPPVGSPVPPPPKPRRQGHGRIRAQDYTGARWVEVPHPDLQPGCRCPLCAQGAVRAQKTKALVLRIEAAPPIAATGYQMERLRCDACGAVFTAPVPAAAGQEKYAPSVGVAVAVLRYGTGVPHYRLERLQQSLGVPLPASTQWELLAPLREQAQPIFDALVVQAANAPLLHQDDTTMRILDLRRPGSATADELARLAPHGPRIRARKWSAGRMSLSQSRGLKFILVRISGKSDYVLADSRVRSRGGPIHPSVGLGQELARTAPQMESPPVV